MPELNRTIALGNMVYLGPFLLMTLLGTFLDLGKYVAQGRGRLQSSWSVPRLLSIFFPWSF